MDPKADCRTNFCTTTIPLYNLQKATSDQWKAARDILAEVNIDENLSTTDMTNNLINILESLVTKCFTKPSPRKSSGTGSNSLIPHNARTMMRRKLNLSRSLAKVTEQTKINDMKDKIKDIEDNLRKSVHSMRAKKERKARENLIRHPNHLHDLVKKINKKSSKICPLKRTNDTKNDSDVEILSKQYKKVFTTPNKDDIFINPEVFFQEKEKNDDTEEEDNLTTFEVTIELINEAIDSLPPKAAPGPDGIPNILIKQLKHEISPILLIIFTKSLDKGELPDPFLKAFIKPVKKPMKLRSDPASYRPLSLTSNIAKILEKVIKKQLVEYLEDKEIINDAQHGFRHKRSCLSQLLSHYNSIIESLEEGKVVDVVYLDFSKAFDTVDRYVLAKHMKAAGINGKAALWIFQFLSGRTQQVISNSTISAPAEVKSGVPQGTVLGPQLFLLMINSITEEELTSRLGLFADDTRVSNAIATNDDIEKLQEDLNTIFDWKTHNNMRFNSDKFDLVRHGATFRSNVNIPKSQYFTDDQDLIPTKDSVRDLGVIVAASTDFHEQILSVCKRARDKTNWIYRSFYSRDVQFLSFMWKCYVQPILDYASQLWSPTKQLEIKMLEDIFRNYSARAQQDNLENLDFWTRLSRYKLRSQQRRSERFIIIYTWKVLEKLVPNCGLKWYSNEKSGRSCVIPTTVSKSSDRVKSLKLSTYQTRGPKLYNALPFSLREITGSSVNVFKNSLDKYLDMFPDMPLSQKYYPIPMDFNTSLPSNSILDWTRLFQVPVRKADNLETIMKNIRSSSKFIEIQSSEWSHLLPPPPLLATTRK